MGRIGVLSVCVGLLGTVVLVFSAWNLGTSRTGASVAAPYNNLVSFVGGAMGIFLLGEFVDSYHILGDGLVAFSLILNGLRF